MAQLVQLPRGGDWVDPDRVSSVQIVQSETGVATVVVTTKDGVHLVVINYDNEPITEFRDAIVKMVEVAPA